MTLEKLLEECNRLKNDEIGLDKQCGEIVSFFFRVSLLFLEMLGVVLLGLIFISIESTIFWWTSLGMFVMLVSVGIGNAALLLSLNMKTLRWKLMRIDRRREQLATHIRDFEAANGNTSELVKILDLINHRGRFRKYSLIFLGLPYFCILLCLMSLVGSVYIMRRGFAD